MRTQDGDQDSRPGSLIRRVGGELTAHGYDLSYHGGEPEYLEIADASGTRCELQVSDWGYVQWQCSLPAPGQIDPHRIADLATVLLTSQRGGFPRLHDGHAHKGATLKGIVGRELAARGLSVSLDIYEDEVAYDVLADIVATNPATSADSRVWVSDEGVITWRSEYPEPTAPADASNVAHAIAETIARAISHAS